MRSIACKIIALIMLATGARAFDATPLMSFFQPPTAPSYLVDNLVYHWKMNDSNATAIVTDSVGNWTNTLISGTTAAISFPGKIGKSLKYPSTIYGTMPASYMAIFTNAFTLTAWVYLNASPVTSYNMPIVSQSGGWAIYMAASGDGRVNVYNGVANYAPLTNGTSAFAWTFMAVAYDGSGKFDFWHNASSNLAYTMAGLPNNGNVGIIGQDQRINSGNTAIDDVRIYSRRLTPPELGLIRNEGSGTEAE